MSKISLNVNGQTHAVDADPETPLLYILRNDLKLNGAKFGWNKFTAALDEVVGRLDAAAQP